jgi:hypothetical protein
MVFMCLSPRGDSRRDAGARCASASRAKSDVDSMMRRRTHEVNIWSDQLTGRGRCPILPLVGPDPAVGAM